MVKLTRNELKVAAIKMLNTNDLKVINDYVEQLTEQEITVLSNFFVHIVNND